jgi:hypothetical protein
MIKIITGTPASIELEFNSWLKENCLISYSLQYVETQGEDGFCSTLLINYETEERLEMNPKSKGCIANDF